MEWISVKDRLPEFDKRVLALDASKEVAILRLHSVTGRKTADGDSISTDWYEQTSYDTYYENVTHWMPLPEPPKQ